MTTAQVMTVTLVAVTLFNGTPERSRCFLKEGTFKCLPLDLVAARRSNCKEQLPPWVSYISKHERKRVEPVFSQIVSAFGRTIHAVTPRGLELKVFLTVLAYTLTV